MADNKWGKGWSMIVLGTKFTKIIKGLSAALKGMKAIGPLVTLGTMTLSIWAYSFALGWALALGLVLLLLVHEMGHVLACQQKGFKVRAPLFIPFVGALIFAPPNMNREQESYIGYGGPLLGSLGALLVWLIWWIMPSHPDILLMSAYFGIFLNLFNLMPVSPLDGGRILQSVGTWIRWVGITILMALTLIMQDVGWLFIWMVVLSDFKIRNRVLIMIGVWSLMVLGYAFDYGVHVPWVLKLFHIGLGALFVFTTWSIDMAGITEEERPPQPKHRAMTWLFSYLTMAALLAGSLVVISHQIHPLIEKKKQEQNSTLPSVNKTIQ